MVHIGAHYGQEINYYKNIGVKVIWVEAHPGVFDKLNVNLKNISNQSSVLALLGDQDLNHVDFNIANNLGASSSIYAFGKSMNTKNLKMLETIKLPMRRFDSIFKEVDLLDFTHWAIDVQGAELKVCRGAGQLLKKVNSLEIEVSTRQEYKGATDYVELKTYLGSIGFVPLWEPKPESHEDIFFINLNK